MNNPSTLRRILTVRLDYPDLAHANGDPERHRRLALAHRLEP